MGLSGVWLALRVFAGGFFKGAIKAISVVVDWLTKDWRNAPLLAFAVGFALCVMFKIPSLEASLEEARADAQENLSGWVAERTAHGQSIVNIQAASDEALADAQANAARVAAEERAINERNARDFETRLAALRVRYDDLGRLRRGREAANQRAGSSGANSAGLPGAGADPARSAEATGDPGLPAAAIDPRAAPACPTGRVCLTLEEAWIASVQAVQLDALISTIEERQAVDYQPEGAGS